MTRSTAHRQAPETAPELGPRPAIRLIGRSGALVMTSGQTAHINGTVGAGQSRGSAALPYAEGLVPRGEAGGDELSMSGGTRW